MPNEPSPRLTLCLAMDLKKSTTTGLKLTTKRLDRFNLALVNQIGPHLSAVGLEKALIKFTGDGWLIMSDEPEHAAPLCCLAIILARRFHIEMSLEASLTPQEIPALRLAICWARDLPVQLPDGTRDFVGDSVRHAVRACQLCHDNEVLIDETVQRWIHHDFITNRLRLPERLAENPEAKMEEELVLHTLDELKVESGEETDAPEYYVNTLAIIGRKGEAEALADQISEHLQSEAEEPNADQGELTERFNRLLASNLDYETASRILKDMHEAGLRPDVRTFNALIAKAQDYETKNIWLQRMKQEGIQPNIATFNTLIAQAEDEATASRWLTKMRREGIEPDTTLLNTLIDRSRDHATAQTWLERMERRGVAPNASTFDLLIEKAEDVQTAMRWIERMFASGIRPAQVSFLTLFSKDVTTISADDLLAWYLGLEFHPPEPMYRAIASYRRSGRIDDALRLCLDYPYMQAAQKVFRTHPERTLGYFRSIVERDPNHANGAYALGIALKELEHRDEAAIWLRRALTLAAPGYRRDEIRRYLEVAENEGTVAVA